MESEAMFMVYFFKKPASERYVLKVCRGNCGRAPYRLEFFSRWKRALNFSLPGDRAPNTKRVPDDVA
jgi:hypothetical protein